MSAKCIIHSLRNFFGFIQLCILVNITYTPGTQKGTHKQAWMTRVRKVENIYRGGLNVLNSFVFFYQ